MALAVIGGLGPSTLVTLLAVPGLYAAIKGGSGARRPSGTLVLEANSSAGTILRDEVGPTL